MWAFQGDSAGKTCNLQSNEKRAHPANRARKTVWALIEFHHHEHSSAHSNERSRGRDRHGWHAGGGPHTELVVCVGRRRRARTRRHDCWRGQPAAPAHSHTTHLATLAAHVRCTLPLRAGCSWGGALAARCPLHPTLHPPHPTRAARRVCGAEILRSADLAAGAPQLRRPSAGPTAAGGQPQVIACYCWLPTAASPGCCCSGGGGGCCAASASATSASCACCSTGCACCMPAMPLACPLAALCPPLEPRLRVPLVRCRP